MKKSTVTTGHTNNTEVTEKMEVFTLKLPADLDIKPKWVVPVSKNYTAQVFEMQFEKTHAQTGLPIGTGTAYRICVSHNKSGLPPRTADCEYNYGRRNESAVLLDVMQALKTIAQELQPKTKTVRTVNEDF
jgi:hypothetical protein